MKTFKFNWGWGILLFFCTFVSFMIFMVYLTTTVDHDLVTADYYKQEIEFQEKIDKKNNLAKSGMKVDIQNNGENVVVHIPTLNQNPIEKAKVYFYRPSDETKDISMENAPQGYFLVPVTQLIEGQYIVQTEWTSDGVTYYNEQNFYMK